MKKRLEELLLSAVNILKEQGQLPTDLDIDAVVERTRDPLHGHFATNLAMVGAKLVRMNPKQLAHQILTVLPTDPALLKVEIAGPGFINFFIDPAVYFDVIHTIHESGHHFGRSVLKHNCRVQMEFVSANPTGPLHVGHGRGAAYGAVVANLLAAIGYDVYREYYVNDAGRQMDILAVSVWVRYLEECGEVLLFPTKGYRGTYVRDIAWELKQQVGEKIHFPWKEVAEGLPHDPIISTEDFVLSEDITRLEREREVYIDALVAKTKSILGEHHYRILFDSGLNSILSDIREDLEEFGVRYNEWFSERHLNETQSVEHTLSALRDAGYLYEKEGAVWFASSRLGDEKDRVVIRENGAMTYFASDIAYHVNKLERGFERVINVWGADHHGYIPRVKAAIKALGYDPNRLEIRLVQFAVLYRGKEKVQMSTRSGEFVTLRQLRNEVGKDAARFFYVMRKSDQHMEFDLKLATSHTNENPVYYVQYAHARICRVFRQLDEKGGVYDIMEGMRSLGQLTQPHETDLINSLSRYPEVVHQSAIQYEPHHLVHYLRDLAHEFHTYYNAHTFLIDDKGLRNARLNLISAVRQVIANGLALLDVTAPESM